MGSPPMLKDYLYTITQSTSRTKRIDTLKDRTRLDNTTVVVYSIGGERRNWQACLVSIGGDCDVFILCTRFSQQT